MIRLVQYVNCSSVRLDEDQNPLRGWFSGLNTACAHRESHRLSGFLSFGSQELDGVPKLDADKVQLRMQPSNTASRGGINAGLESCTRTRGIRVETTHAASKIARQPVRLSNVLTEGTDLELGRKGLTDFIRDKSLFAFAQGQINQ